MEKGRVVNQKDHSELRTFSTAPQTPFLQEELRNKTLLTQIIPNATIITITGCKVRYVSK